MANPKHTQREFLGKSKRESSPPGKSGQPSMSKPKAKPQRTPRPAADRKKISPRHIGKKKRAVEKITAFLTGIIGEKLGLPPQGIQPQTAFFHLGVTSLISEEILVDIRRVFKQVSPTLLFDYPTIQYLANHLAPFLEASQDLLMPECKPGNETGQVKTTRAVPARVKKLPRAEKQQKPTKSVAFEEQGPADIAVIGMSGRFPGAEDVDTLWHNLVGGKSAIVEIPENRWPMNGFFDPEPQKPNRSYSKWAGLLSEFDRFDPLFFNISPKEAEFMDPQQRLFLQEAWRALENAGYAARELAGTSCGVFVGVEDGDYHSQEPEINAYSLSGHSIAILAARIAYLLNLKGPSVPVNTACSSSLVAVHLACESIRSGTCTLALAGGVALLTSPKTHISLSQLGVCVGGWPLQGV